MNEVCNESTTLVPLELGFVQKADPWKLTSHSFPSKVGGRPAWLALATVPKNLKCDECQRELSFLLQVYSPIEGKSNCFHRSIYLFICGNGSCYQEGKTPTIRAFRSQLPRENPYYTEDVIDELSLSDISNGLHTNIKHSKSVTALCATCGCYGDILCEKCEKITYCSKEHKKIDFEVRHEVECSELSSGEKSWYPLLDWSKNNVLFPECELVMGPDPHCDVNDDESDDSCKNGEEKSFRESDGENTENKLEPMAVDSIHHQENIDIDYISKLNNQKKTENRYHRSIAREPNQVLRYHRGGEPLWISEKHRLSEPPPCPLCGAERQFEFQVLPQLLNHLHLEFQGNSIDWGSLFVYTCSASCNGKADTQVLKDHGPPTCEYSEEFVWKQDIVD